MNNIRKLTDSLFWVGVNDRRIALFENVYPVPTGMSYNSYVLLDEKTALFDTVDASFTHDFLENVTAALNGRTLDYLIVTTWSRTTVRPSPMCSPFTRRQRSYAPQRLWE